LKAQHTKVNKERAFPKEDEVVKQRGVPFVVLIKTRTDLDYK